MTSLGINRIRLEFKGRIEPGRRKKTEIVLIESDWNLKQNYVQHSRSRNLRINRIRLEFKANTLGFYYEPHPSINRIRLEFKDSCCLFFCIGFHRINRIRLEFKVLQNKLLSLLSSCINRIRLEFKVIRRQFCIMGHLVLIESDWNLKENW